MEVLTQRNFSENITWDILNWKVHFKNYNNVVFTDLCFLSNRYAYLLRVSRIPKLVSKPTTLEIQWRTTECFRHSRCPMRIIPLTLYFPETAVSLYGSVLSKVSKKPQWCQSKWHLREIGLTPGQDRQSSWKPPIWLASFSPVWSIQSNTSHLWKTSTLI